MFDVVINTEEQYSIWPKGFTLPAGWVLAGTDGSREHCLAHIAEVWQDMRPRSVREAMSAMAGSSNPELSKVIAPECGRSESE
jgi:MbtH protein